MSPSLLLLLTGLLYVLFFGALSLLRREGLSARFAVEAVAITLLAAGLSYTGGFDPHPVMFLVVLYLLTLRVRLLVDLGNAMARRGNRDAAARVYRLALRLWPDEASRLSVEVNQGVLSLQNGLLDEAIAIFERVLGARNGFLGVKNECGCHYNLGVAYSRKGLAGQAVREFNAVLDTWPASEYARHARLALERRKTGDRGDPQTGE